MSSKYGAFNAKEGVANRRSFLIDSEGIIRFMQESSLDSARKHNDMIAAVQKLGKGPSGESPAARSKDPVEARFYEFYSETCSHCKEMKPVVDEFQRKHEKDFKQFLLIPFKGSDNISLFHEYGVSQTPTFVITDTGGKEIDRISGVHGLEALENFMNNSFARMR